MDITYNLLLNINLVLTNQAHTGSFFWLKERACNDNTISIEHP